MLQYINVPIGCAVFRMAIGTLTYWHIVALTHYLFYFTQTSFRREINVFRIALISHLTTTGCFRSQRTGHITFHITRGTGTSSYIYRLHTFCLYIPTTTGSIRSVLTNTCQNYISGRAGISREICTRYLSRITSPELLAVAAKSSQEIMLPVTSPLLLALTVTFPLVFSPFL